MSDFLKNVPKGTEDDDVQNPLKSAQQAMQPELPKRFYKAVEVAQIEGDFQILLDGRVLKTPGKNTITMPTREIAVLLRDEWDAQTDRINPTEMPATRIVNTAIDAVADKKNDVLEDVVKFAGSDLLCYRAGQPEELIELQSQHWDHVLNWLRDTHDANFILIEGVTFQEQPSEAIAVLRGRLEKHADPIGLTCLHTFTSLTGSALLAFALAEAFLTLEEAWTAAHVDEDWNIARWGQDYEAETRREKRFREMHKAHQVFMAR